MTGDSVDDPRAQGINLLAQCRQDIDRIDAVLVALLHERTRLAVDAGRLKTTCGQPLVAPGREAAVFERVRRLARAPLEPDAVARIFERIIEEARAAEAHWTESQR
jgi:chorismate mutase